jgi:CubicO group peptidase (beta-lactamase class C family)
MVTPDDPAGVAHGEKAEAPPIDGECDTAFTAVGNAFRENFRSRNEIGAGLCIRIDGRVVVDLWGGHHDEARTRPWKRDTLVNAYSVGKGVTAMLVLSLVERGELQLDDPIMKIWPEFGVEGKEQTTLRMLLAHRAGLPGIRRPLDANAMFDWKAMAEALAEQRAYWDPGESHGYHVNTFGFLVGEPVCRRLRLPFAAALRERLTGPAGADFFIGLPDSEHGRVAPIFQPRPTKKADADWNPIEAARTFFIAADAERDEAREAMIANTYFNPAGLSGFGVVNDPAWRRASIPSTNGHGTARAVAELYDLFANRDVSKGGLVGRGLREEALEIQSDGVDQILGKPSRFGLGFQLSQPTRPIGRSPEAFGHYGYGGTLGFADPETGVAFGYLMNRPGDRWQTPRTNGLLEALYDSLGIRDPADERAEDPTR